MKVWLKFPVQILLIAASLGTLGCGDGVDHFSVTGRALYQGEPMAGAQLFLHPVDDMRHEAIRPGAQVQDDGSFEVVTMGEVGAPPGEYRVTIYWDGPKLKPGRTPKAGSGNVMEGNSEEGGGPNYIKPPHSDPSKSPILVTVKDQDITVPIEIP